MHYGFEFKFKKSFVPDLNTRVEKVNDFLSKVDFSRNTRAFGVLLLRPTHSGESYILVFDFFNKNANSLKRLQIKLDIGSTDEFYNIMGPDVCIFSYLSCLFLEKVTFKIIDLNTIGINIVLADTLIPTISAYSHMLIDNSKN